MAEQFRRIMAGTEPPNRRSHDPTPYESYRAHLPTTQRGVGGGAQDGQGLGGSFMGQRCLSNASPSARSFGIELRAAG